MVIGFNAIFDHYLHKSSNPEFMIHYEGCFGYSGEHWPDLSLSDIIANDYCYRDDSGKVIQESHYDIELKKKWETK